MSEKHTVSRRRFLGSAAATAATISIVPRHVVAGSGKTPPSEQITVANIGCGTQGLSELGGLLEDDRVRVVAVCDPNKFSTDYIDWSMHRVRNRIRQTLQDDSWGEGDVGIPCGRDVGQRFVDRYYAKFARSAKASGCRAYEDFRDLLANEPDLDLVKIMTPDHLHATIALAAMNRGVHAVTHKPIANRMSEARLAINKARETGLFTHLLAWSERPQYGLIKRWIDDGVIGRLREIHNWSNRPVWKQWARRPTESIPVPDGFNWPLWLGPVPDMPYHPHYTHNVFRGWYDFGGGSIADMGHYSLFPLFETLGITRPPVAAKAYGTRTRELVGNLYDWDDENSAFPYSCMVRLEFPAQENLPEFNLFWYDGGMKPFAPEELVRDGRDIPQEGLLFVGDEAKILAGFRGQTPQIVPREKMRRYDGPRSVKVDESEEYWRTDWVDALVNGRESPGSFVRAETVTEAINLGIVAIRSGKRVEYDSKAMRITNDSEADGFLYRKAYRPGWKMDFSHLKT